MAQTWTKLRIKMEGDYGQVRTDSWHLVGEVGGASYGANYADFSSTTKAAYRKDPWGWVHLRGSVKRSASPAVAGETILTMPTGYRPTQLGGFACSSAGSAVTKALINTNGVLEINDSTALASSATRIYLDGISYRAEQ